MDFILSSCFYKPKECGLTNISIILYNKNLLNKFTT